jgi:hypothetical protein
MISVMERIRVYFDAAEELRLALKQEALKAGVTVSALIEQALRDKFPKAVEEAKKVLRDRTKKGGAE